MVPLGEEHQDLLQLLYTAPVGLINTSLTGGILLINAVAAQLLMPLSRDGQVSNLFSVLEAAVPDIRFQVARFRPSYGRIFDAMPIQVGATGGDRTGPKILSLTVTKIDEHKLVVSLSDVTEQQRIASQIAESEARMRALFDAALDAVISMDAQGHVTEWNKQAQSIFGWSRDEVMGLTLHDAIAPPQCRMAHQLGLTRFLATGQTEFLGRRMEMTALRRCGEEFPVELSILPFKKNGIHHFTAFIADISSRKRVEALVRQLAYYDPLTSLANRTLLQDRLTQSMRASERSRCYGAFMFLDLDNFKPVNDQHGHRAGDLLLVEVARRLKRCVRQIDTVARIGGDEFAVLLDDLTADKAQAHHQAELLAEKARSLLDEVYQLELRDEVADTVCNIEHLCTASIGVVLFIGLETTVEEVLKRADSAMYQAKEAGRNQVRFLDVLPRRAAPGKASPLGA